MFLAFVAVASIGLLASSSDGRKLHPNLLSKRDWSKVSHQFDLKKHLMTPTSRDLHDGVENSGRLARNAMKLGIANDEHRKVRLRPCAFQFHVHVLNQSTRYYN
jgi:hypothetical protein